MPHSTPNSPNPKSTFRNFSSLGIERGIWSVTYTSILRKTARTRRRHSRFLRRAAVRAGQGSASAARQSAARICGRQEPRAPTVAAAGMIGSRRSSFISSANFTNLNDTGSVRHVEWRLISAHVLVFGRRRQGASAGSFDWRPSPRHEVAGSWAPAEQRSSSAPSYSTGAILRPAATRAP